MLPFKNMVEFYLPPVGNDNTFFLKVLSRVKMLASEVG
jgi:hypothetical protein